MLFPSTEWFSTLAKEANANSERFRLLGTVDITLVAKIDYPGSSKYFEIVFAGYRCLGVKELPRLESASKGAVILEGSADTWRTMIDNIQRNGKADLTQTLNTLTLFDTPMRVSAENQLDTDLFYRYQQNLQEFFDAAAKTRTEFATAQAQHSMQ